MPGPTGGAPPAPLPPLPNIPLARGVTSPERGVWHVAFETGSEEIPAPRRAALLRIGGVLNTGSVGRVTVIAEVGSGDDLSTTRRLSLARARAVKDALVAGGLAETRIDLRPMGHRDAGQDIVAILAPTVARP
nr:OmpA family protein [uncultured Roseococcus sp.]